MKGFKDFLMRGNLVELAVAFIMATAFAKVVETFTAVILDLVGKLGGTADFSSLKPWGISLGAFLTALLAFVVMAAVVYFGIVKPYNALKDRLTKPAEEEATGPTSEELLSEIRDLLKQRN